MRPDAALLAAALFTASSAAGQTPAAAAGEEAAAWSFSMATYAYQVRDDRNYAQPTFTADRDWLNLEARYNYEDMHAGSLWIGHNLEGGDTLAWALTPMFGGVVGKSLAFAPAYKGSVSWWWLGFSSEGEYVFDTADSSENFFYNWSELTLSPADWWRVGLVTQRTRVYATDRDIQRGLLLGFAYKNLDSAIYLLNPDDSRPVVVVSVTVGF